MKISEIRNFWQKTFKWNRFVGVHQFLDIDRKPHIMVWTRNAVYEYDPTGKSTKPLFRLEEAEQAAQSQSTKQESR